MILEGFNQLPILLIPQKIFLDLNNTISYSKPNGPHPLGLFFYSLQILFDPVHRSDPVHGLEGQVEGRLAFEAGTRGDLLQIKLIMPS
jgi:hypothetical protein